VLTLQRKALAALLVTAQTAEQIAAVLGAPEETETVYLLLEHLAANGRAHMAGLGDPGQATFSRKGSESS
jgi:glucose-6-phosphate isomerase